MPDRRKLALLSTLLLASGCRTTKYAPPETPMPANTVLLSQMMRELSAQPGFTEALLKQLNASDKKDSFLTPALVDDLRQRILGKDWQRLNRFPGWNMTEINPTIRVAGHLAGKDDKLEAASEAHPGAPLGTGRHADLYLDIGPYALDRAETESLDLPSTLPPFTTDGIVTTLGDGVTRGDGPNALAPEHPEAQRFADILNRLAANQLKDVLPFTVTTNIPTLPEFAAGGSAASLRVPASSPQDLIASLQETGHTITVTDTRYFANFAHLHYKGQDVMAPFWINSQIVVPHSNGRPLLIPVSHAELEWHIRGPILNADVSHYFGIDGKAEWRVMDTLDQAWVMKRDAHTYTGKDAVEVTRLAGMMTAAYMRLHAAYPKLPFGGYYAFGVCQDLVSAIEHKMTGHSTLFPNTADLSYFNDPKDAEVNGMIATIPKDRKGTKPEPERVFGSLPATPAADVNEAFSSITIPGLSADLNLTYAAWKDGTLERTHTWFDALRAYLFLGSAIALAFYFAIKTRRFLDRNQKAPVQRNPYK